MFNRRLIRLYWKHTIFGVASVGLSCAFRPQVMEARPLYMDVFKKVYPDYQAEETKCSICHSGKDKKTRNDYGKAIEEALGAKNVKDEKAIEAALKKCEDKLPGKKP